MTKKLISGVVGKVGKCKTFKSAKKGQKSFRITQSMLKKLWNDSEKINNKGVLVISIPSEDGKSYILNAVLTKEG